MLILTRRLGESIAIGDKIKITFLGIKGKQIRIGIEAPAETIVHRQEIYELIKKENIEASVSPVPDGTDLSKLWRQITKK